MGDAGSFGRESEEAAAEFLRRSGYRILARNHRTRLGEIDVVAADGETVVFVEIKARRSLLYGGTHDAVDRRKRKRLSRLARQFLAFYGMEDRPCRFDLVLIDAPAGRMPAVELMKNAFEAEGEGP